MLLIKCGCTLNPSLPPSMELPAWARLTEPEFLAYMLERD